MTTVTGQRSAYVLVPRTPTEEMVDEAWPEALGEDAKGVWRSMIETWERSFNAIAMGTQIGVAGNCCPANETQESDS